MRTVPSLRVRSRFAVSWTDHTGKQGFTLTKTPLPRPATATAAGGGGGGAAAAFV
eukprot:SAG22_NODE_837_length_6911_cov_4.576629_13_plen_54_part_01